jgi:Kef-type K+ transport system membrane component KefB
VLLFQVGLESTIGQMVRVGVTALVVALLGVVAPFALGWGVSALLRPDANPYSHLFLGAVLCATSVGITARVLQDLGRSTSAESRIILGAAVFDDVLGLVILAVVSGLIAAADAGRTLSVVQIGLTIAQTTAFLVGAIAIGMRASPALFGLASRLRARGALLATGLAFCFLLAGLSNVVGLAPIIGAFAAGLILEDLHYKDFVSRGEHSLEELIHPIADFLVPIFFVLMGMRTGLASLVQPGVPLLAAGLIVAAIVGKQLCGLGVLSAGVDRVTVGIGMVPRGEVGLIFANVGLGLTIAGVPIIDSATFSALVGMVIVTTMVTPPALKWSLSRRRHAG